ncbi:MAG: repressor LexA [Candidatus Doudnabacteria bacterium RIFCSPHIGHO2_01_FULL_43_23]|uniref:LexA repressor n=1 Tax=Candidatus Doudnabacteria bacterium RIFCSPHIGHO2_01_FULL_43_23 TaxID=1817822 RepID=A0A1F5NQD3_9BACT|nr:MAG: repressor LexA [Candidatus Doudnabacteria bacterium RIFCSPHIGHO2_01_FULL_43_23]
MSDSRQQNLLSFIKETLDGRGFPPTISEMAKEVGVKSKNAIFKMLKKLEAQGVIERDSTARGIRLLNPEGGMVGSMEFSAPLIGTVTAGTPILAEENIESWVNLPTTMVRSPKQVFVLKVRGDSMRDAGILDGDLVIVDSKKEARNRDIVVALLQDEATVKRYMEINGRKYLKAENPKYKNIHPKSEWTISGKVVGVIRNIN